MANGLGKWIAIGCAGLLGLGCLGTVAGGVFVFVGMRSDEAFTTADAWVRANPALVEQVGTPIRTGWLPQGSVTEGDPATAEFTHHLTGPRGEATVHTSLVREEAGWTVVRASVDEGGRPVTLAADPEAVAVDEGTVRVADELAAAQRHYLAGKDDATIAAADVVLDIDPSNPQAHYWRGRAEARQSDNERAIADFEAAVGKDPGFADAWEGLAYANVRAGHDREAIAALDKLLELRPEDAKAWADRANAKYREGDRAGARADAVASCQRSYQPGCDLEARLAKMGG